MTGMTLRCFTRAVRLAIAYVAVESGLQGILVQDFSDLEQDLEETTAEDSRQGKDMQVRVHECAPTAFADK